MQINATLVSFEVDVQVSKNGGGTYKGCRLAYRDENGALKEKGFSEMAFKFIPQVKTVLMNLKSGDQFTAEVIKEGEFWNWKSVQAGGTPAPVADKDVPATGKATPYQAPKSTYETAEERAQKQVYIVRQSSITAALKFAEINKIKVDSVESLIPYAKEFESYVMGIHFDDGTLAGMHDDSAEVY